MKDLVSPKQVAQAIDVSESSLKRWCDQGLIPAVRTAGGHRRLPVNGVLAFLRSSGHPLVHPEILGLPPVTSAGQLRKLADQRERLIDALVEGNEPVCVEIVLNLYLSRVPMSLICDDLLARAFEEIGRRCGCGDVAVYQERRSCELCHRLMHEVRRALPELPASAPLALGAAVEGDPYSLASSMAELVLRENGWRACSLGGMVPFLSLRQAVCDMQPRLLWLNVSVIQDRDTFLTEFAKLAELAEEHQIAVAVGGCALTGEVREGMRYSCYGETFQQLEAFARELFPHPPPAYGATAPDPRH